MAKQTLPTNFVDDILSPSMGGKRKYRIIDNGDGTYSFEDVTEYTQTGSDFGAGQINATNQAVNESCDKANVIDDLDDIVANQSDGMIAGAKAVADLNRKLSEPHLMITEQTIGPFSVNNGGAITEELLMTPPPGYKLVLPIMGQTGTRYTFQYSCVLNSEVENGYIIQMANYSGFNSSGFTPKMYFICEKEQ